MKLIINVKNENTSEILLKKGSKLIDHENLTISQGFDKLLITAIDNIISRNKIERLSLKSLVLSGKMKSQTVSSMIMKTVALAFEA